MGANIWFWLIIVLVGIFGIFMQNPWRPAGGPGAYPWAPFGSWLILFILIGILGEYLARVLEQVRHRPRFIVSETVGLAAHQLAPSAAVSRRD